MAASTEGEYAYAQYGAFRGGQKVIRIIHDGNKWVAEDIETDDELFRSQALKNVKQFCMDWAAGAEPEKAATPGIPARRAGEEFIDLVDLGTDARGHLLRLAAWSLQFYGAMWPKEPVAEINGICKYSVECLDAFGRGIDFRNIGVPERFMVLLGGEVKE